MRLLVAAHAARPQGRTAVVLALAVGIIAVAPSAAGAAPGTTPAPTATPPAPGRPTIRRIRCVRDCPSTSTARPGARIRVAGSGLDVVRRVVFNGRAGPDDDVTVRARPRSDRSVIVAVPDAAVTGPLSAVAARAAVHSRPSRPLTIVPSDVAGDEEPAPATGGGAHAFPVAGPHTFGGPASRFGASRDGRSHEGQDVFASCGTRLVAAAGGVVSVNRFQSLAGNYVVIDGPDNDYVYMHMASPSPLAIGQPVTAGQDVGVVGATGNAQGCHLHFEVWSGAYRAGGAAIDPLPLLQSWGG